MTNKALYTLLAAGLLTLGACSTDEPMTLPGADGSTAIDLLIPAPDMAHANTRAVDNAHGDRLASEGTISRLAVVGFYKEGTALRHFYTEFTQDQATAVNDVYRSYRLNVVPAEYTLYVLGNIDMASSGLLNELKGTATASDLESRVAAMTYAYDALPQASAGLPMARKTSATVAEHQQKQVVVQMEYLCAKVRMTVLYNNAYGSTKPFAIDAMDVCDAYSPTGIFNPSTGAGKKTFTDAGTGAHYRWDAPDAEQELDYWTAMPAEGDDPLDKFSEKLTGDSWTRFAYQNTVYIPECKGKGGDATHLLLNAGDLKARINIGCDNATHTDNLPGDIERGNFYDVVAMVDGGEVTYSYRVAPWTVQNMAVQLAGQSRLFLSQTSIEMMDGDNPVEIYYESDAPMLTFDIPTVKYEGMTEELPLFEVRENKRDHLLVVTINPDLPINTQIMEGTGFWVISGNITKFVEVKKVDLRPYLRLLPTAQSVSVGNIANEAYYRVYFDYATNAEGLSMKLASYTNTNRSKDYTDATGLYLEICGSDSVPVTRKMTLAAGLDLMAADNLLPGKVYPNDGFIRMTLQDPTNSNYYAKQIKATFNATVANDAAPARNAELTIEPNPTVYTIHFKAINGVEWGYTHIYVYQALYMTDGYPVFGSSGDSNINWIEYSFTGNRAFKGWKSEGGTIDDLTFEPTNFNDGGGSPVKGYHVGSSWGDPGKNEGIGDAYYNRVTLIDYTQSDCSDCKQNKLNNLWPGMGMTKEEDGWWKIELPLLAKPGSALIMFNNGHYEGARYPASGVPGIPLPDYSDREAWYLLDQARGGDKCSFSDDPRESYDD